MEEQGNGSARRSGTKAQQKRRTFWQFLQEAATLSRPEVEIQRLGCLSRRKEGDDEEERGRDEAHGWGCEKRSGMWMTTRELFGCLTGVSEVGEGAASREKERELLVLEPLTCSSHTR